MMLFWLCFLLNVYAIKCVYMNSAMVSNSTLVTEYFNATLNSNPAAAQLKQYAAANPHPSIVTSSSGAPVDDLTNTLSAGPNGPLLMQDTTFYDIIQAFTRERVPARVVHANGAGATGYLQINHDISNFSLAKMFSQVGAKIPVTARFSRVVGEMGSADTGRDTRGFALKFYTSDGIWDLVGINLPVFFTRDPIAFPDIFHSMSRNPVTHLLDHNAMWDFFTLNPQTLYQGMYIYSDYGIPMSYRNMNGYGVNAFELLNSNGTTVLAKFVFTTNQGLKNLPVGQANILAGVAPDYYTQDLYNAIANGNYPSWNFSIQVMTKEQAQMFPWNPLDSTKIWPTSDYPLIPVGELILNQNPINYFVEVESIGFNPSRLVPGIYPSLDKVLQGRLFAYSDAQSYRLGINSPLLKINAPLQNIHNYMRDGFAHYGKNQGPAVNYYPNSFHGPVPSPRGRLPPYPVNGVVGRYNTGNEDNISQPRIFYEQMLTPDQQRRLAANLASVIIFTYPNIQARAVSVFGAISPQLGSNLQEMLRDGTLIAMALSSS